MQDFNSIYDDYHQAYNKGHNDGSNQAQQQQQLQEIIKQSIIFAKQLGEQLSIYETFISEFTKMRQQDSQSKRIKKLHSVIIDQKLIQLIQNKNKLQQLLIKSNNQNKSLQQIDYSIQLLQYDRKDIKSKFQTILSILGIKQYLNQALIHINQSSQSQINQSSQQQTFHNHQLLSNQQILSKYNNNNNNIINQNEHDQFDF